MDFEGIDRDFGAAVRAARVDRGISQEDLAAEVSRLGYPLSQATVGKIERGERKVTVGEAHAVASALQMSTSELILGPSHVNREILAGRLEILREELVAAARALDSGKALVAIEAGRLSDYDQDWLRDDIFESVEEIIDSYRKDMIVSNESAQRRNELDGALGDTGGHDGLYGEYIAKFGNSVPAIIDSHAAEVILRRAPKSNG